MKSFFFAMAATALLAGSVQSKDTTTFGVDSYVPERFTDFRWRLTGQTFIGGGERDYRSDYIGPSYIIRDSSHYSDDNQDASLSSDIKYSYTTIPLIWSLGIIGQLNAGHSSGSNTHSSYFSPSGFYTDGVITGSNTNWGFNLTPTASLTRYISGDFFAGGTLREQVQYSARNSHSETESHRIEPGDSVASYGQSTEDLARFDIENMTTVSVKVGLGRMYSGSFAFAATSVIRELKSAGLLTRMPSKEEMLTLCDTILEYRQRHMIDYRLRRISALRAVLNYLHSIGSVGEIDSYTPFVVADVWDYFPRASRSFGYMMTSGVELTYGSTYWHEDYDRWTSGVLSQSGERYSKRHNGGVALFEKLEWSKPLNYHWQLDAQAAVWYIANGYLEDGYSGIIATDRGYWVHSIVVSGVYFKDSRTSFASSVGTFSNTNRYQSRYLNMRERRTELSAEMVYRLSVPTTLNIGVSTNWDSRTNEFQYNRSRIHSYALTASLQHWLY